MVRYKDIEKNDYSEFLKLLTDYYREGEDADTEQSVLDEFIKHLFSLVVKGQIRGCLLYQNDRLAGFVLWMIDAEDSDFSELPGFGTFLEIGICPPFRAQGMGRRVVETVEEHIREQGTKNFYVSVYPAASGFWEQCGYRKTHKIDSNGLFIYVKEEDGNIWKSQ